MFEGQPKGLYALALANTGERFGYYTMLAIFTLFLQAKFGFTAATTSTIFASFLAGVYFMPLIGGILADKFGYGKMVTTGIVIMFAGYVLLAIPMATNIGLYSMFGALALIALGTGLFKGNLQVMVGNLYDAPEYSAKRDTAFSLFYMAINIGAVRSDCRYCHDQLCVGQSRLQLCAPDTFFGTPVPGRYDYRRRRGHTDCHADRTEFHRKHG